MTGAGAGIDAATGLVSIPTDALLAGAEVTVTARNSGGEAALSFRVDVAVAWPAGLPAGLWQVSGITDPDEAAAAGHAGQSGHLKAVFGAFAPAPAGFTLHHDIAGGATDPAALPQVAAGMTVITAGVVPVGDTAYPRLYWRHTATGTFRIAVEHGPVVIQGLKLEAPVLLDAPSLAGTGRIGHEVGVETGRWGGKPAPALAVRWLRGGAEIDGATGASYLPVAADDGAELRARIVATSIAGSLAAETAALRVTYPAPVAAGELPDEVFDQGSGTETVPTAFAFGGAGLRYAVTGAGAGIDAETGLVSIPTDVAVDGARVTVTASNSGGSVSLSFLVAVEAAAGGIVWPAALAPGDFVIAEVTDPAEAAANGFAGVTGRVRYAASAPGAGFVPAGFTLILCLWGETPGASHPPIAAAGTRYSTGTRTVGTSFTPRAYWKHAASGTFQECWAAPAPIVIRGLSAPAFTAGPAVSGTANVGETLTVAYAAANHTSAVVQWYRGSAAIGGATGASYVLQAADDRAVVSAQVTLSGVGSVTGSAGLPVTYAAPVAAGSIADQSLEQAAGAVASIETAALFGGGAGRVYAVSGHAAATIDPATGVLAISRGAPVAATAITVTATNSGGAAQLTFGLTVTAGSSIVWPGNLAQGDIVVAEVTDPAEASANGFAGVGGRLRFTVATPGTGFAPSGFALILCAWVSSRDRRRRRSPRPAPPIPPARGRSAPASPRERTGSTRPRGRSRSAGRRRSSSPSRACRPGPRPRAFRCSPRPRSTPPSPARSASGAARWRPATPTSSPGIRSRSWRSPATAATPRRTAACCSRSATWPPAASRRPSRAASPCSTTCGPASASSSPG